MLLRLFFSNEFSNDFLDGQLIYARALSLLKQGIGSIFIWMSQIQV